MRAFFILLFLISQNAWADKAHPLDGFVGSYKIRSPFVDPNYEECTSGKVEASSYLKINRRLGEEGQRSYWLVLENSESRIEYLLQQQQFPKTGKKGLVDQIAAQKANRVYTQKITFNEYTKLESIFMDYGEGYYIFSMQELFFNQDGYFGQCSTVVLLDRL